MNRTIRSPGTSSFCVVYKSLGQCSLDGLPGQLSYRRIIPTKSAIGLSHRNDTLQNRRFPWHLRVNARGGTRSTNSPNAEIVVISDLCHILCLERVAIANREARHHGAAIYHRHLEAISIASLQDKRHGGIGDHGLRRRHYRRGRCNNCRHRSFSCIRTAAVRRATALMSAGGTSAGRLACIFHRCLKRIHKRIHLVLRCHAVREQRNRFLPQGYNLCICIILGLFDQLFQFGCIRNQAEFRHRNCKTAGHGFYLCLGRIGLLHQFLRFCKDFNKFIPRCILDILIFLISLCNSD